MKRALSAITLSFMLFPCVSFADHITGMTAFTSNYIWRGVSQSDNNPAIQGEFAYETDEGFSFGVWGSSIDLPSAPDASAEFDPYIRYTHALNDDWNVGGELLYYTYPDESGENYWEGSLFATYQFITATFAFTNDNFGEGNAAQYYELSAEHTILYGSGSEFLDNMLFGGHVGYFNQDSSDRDGGSYEDVALYVAEEIKGVRLELGWTDTFNREANDDLGDSHFYATISKSFT